MTTDDVKARAVEVLAQAAHRHACKLARQNGGEEGIEWAKWKHLPEFAQEAYRAEARDLVKALRAAGLLADPDAIGRAEAEALRNRIWSLSLQWLRDQAEYPDTKQGRAAAAAVRLCGREMVAELQAALVDRIDPDAKLTPSDVKAWRTEADADQGHECRLTDVTTYGDAQRVYACTEPGHERETEADHG
jgi:hypothetical protein